MGDERAHRALDGDSVAVVADPCAELDAGAFLAVAGVAAQARFEARGEHCAHANLEAARCVQHEPQAGDAGFCPHHLGRGVRRVDGYVEARLFGEQPS